MGPVEIIVCQCGFADAVPQEVKTAVKDGLSARRGVWAVMDLCGLAARKDPRLLEAAANPRLAVIACHPRAVRWLLRWAGVETADAIRFWNLRTQDAATILAGLGAAGDDACDSVWETQKPDAWTPWFPVLDFDRCVGCRQCLDFCLFGVYSPGGDNAVQVTKPAGCKTGCPACARVCPHAAIMFPKYAQSPINGDEVTEANWTTCQAMPGEMSPEHLKEMLALRRAKKGKSLIKE
jgi:NAD-dependent dihydropyrimidine dehydrogenase PreA subunit